MSLDSEAACAAGEPEPGARAWLPWLVLALALSCLPLVRLGQWSLWIDEAFTLTDSKAGQAYANPLGYRLYQAWLALLPERPDERWLRLPSALLGVLGVPLTFWAFRPALGGLRAALAALLLACSAWHLYWAQNARFYTLAQDLALLGAGMWLRALLGGAPALALAGLAALGAASLAHPSAAGLVPAFLVVPWLAGWRAGAWPERSRRAQRWMLGLALAAAVPGAFWAWQIFQKWSAAKGGGDPLHFALTSGFHMSPLLLAGAAFGALCAWRTRERAGLLVAGVCAIFMLLAAASAILVRVSAQYSFVALPWVCALAALPLTSLARAGWAAGRRLASVGYAAVLVLPALANCALYLSVRGGERPPWRDAYRYVFEHRREGDLVLGMEAPVGEYYLSPELSDLRKPRELGWLDSWRAAQPALWSRYPRRTWFVLNPEQLDDWRDKGERRDFEEMLRTDCRLMACWPLYVESRDLSVWVYLREP